MDIFSRLLSKPTSDAIDLTTIVLGSIVRDETNPPLHTICDNEHWF